MKKLVKNSVSLFIFIFILHMDLSGQRLDSWLFCLGQNSYYNAGEDYYGTIGKFSLLNENGLPVSNPVSKVEIRDYRNGELLSYDIFDPNSTGGQLIIKILVSGRYRLRYETTNDEIVESVITDILTTPTQRFVSLDPNCQFVELGLNGFQFGYHNYVWDNGEQWSGLSAVTTNYTTRYFTTTSTISVSACGQTKSSTRTAPSSGVPPLTEIQGSPNICEGNFEYYSVIAGNGDCIKDWSWTSSRGNLRWFILDGQLNKRII
jgi:hypothetical protein